MRQRVAAASAALLAFLVLGILAVIWFGSAERARDIQTLQTQMNIVVDSREAALRGWLQEQYAVLTGLAENESLQIYVSVVSPGADGQPLDDDPAQLEYLVKLLTATGERTGFALPRSSNTLDANVKPLGQAGLALVSPSNDIIAATTGMPPIEGRLAQFLSDTPEDQRGMLDVYMSPAGTPTLAFVAPVFGQQGVGGATTLLARVVGVRSLDNAFFATLYQPGSTARTAETYLVRRVGNMIEYMSPLLDRSLPFAKHLAANTDNLVDAAALENPGLFVTGRGYNAADSFAVSRKVQSTDWVMVHKIDRSEALASSDQRRLTLMTALISAVLVMAGTLVAVWRYASSVKAEEAARQYRASAERFEALSGFLDVVTDSQPNPIFLTNAKHVVSFGNQRAASISGIPEKELAGRSLIGILGHDKATVYNQINTHVLQSSIPSTEVQHFRDDQGNVQVWRSHHTPFFGTEDRSPAVLTTIEDLTDLEFERTRRERNTQQLIDALVKLVDERDPASAHQSHYAAIVAKQIAVEMGLEPTHVYAAEQAARLLNIGKIRVPRALLTKDGSLTDEERELIQAAMDGGPAILQDIEFDGPVVETLRQTSERADGAGRPRGLTGDQILPTAQAVAVANYFVALLSPRAFREGMSFEEAEEQLMQEIGGRFDKRAVLSLLNFLSNKGGRDAWMEIAWQTSHELLDEEA